MKVERLAIPDVLLLTPPRYSDQPRLLLSRLKGDRTH